jgi:PST family polysaccharide transporter
MLKVVSLASQRISLGARRIISNSVWLFADRGLSILNGLIISAWVVRYLGPTRFGQYSYVVAFVALFSPLAELGLSTIVVRNLVNDPSHKERLLGTAFSLQLIGGAVTFILMTGLALTLYSVSDPTFWMIVAVGIQIVFTPCDVVGYWFESQVQSKYVVWTNNIVLLAMAVIRIALILLQAPLIAFAFVLTFQALFTAVGFLVFYRVSGQAVRAWRISWEQAKRLLADSWPLIVSALAVVVYVKIDKIMLARMVDDKAVGIYSAAVYITEIWYFVPTVIASSVFPAIVLSRKVQSEQVYLKRVQLFYDIMTCISYAITIPLVFLASPLIVTVFGTDYAASGPILAVHILSLVFTFMGVARGKWLIAENLGGLYMLTTISGAVVNVILNLWLIPRYAGLGAAWATVIAYAFSAYLSCLFSRKLWPTFGRLSLSFLAPFRMRSLIRSLNEVFLLRTG